MQYPVTVDTAADTSNEQARRTKLRQLTTALWAPVLLVVAALAMCITVVGFHGPAFSPVDEWVYYDYLVKLPQQGVVHQGEHLSRQALEHMSCDGERTYGVMGVPCGGDYGDYAKYPYHGKTTADAYTPFYFGVTWVLGKAISFVSGLHLLTAARLTGFFWLAAGLLLFYRLAREFRVPKLAIVGVGLGFIASTFSWWTYTYVSTDAPAFVFGTAMLLLAVRFLAGRSSGWWLLLVGVVAVLFKVTNIFAVGLAVLVLLFFAFARAYASRRAPPGEAPGGSGELALPPPRQSIAVAADRFAPSMGKILLIAGSVVVAAIAAELLWLEIRAAIAVGPPPYGDILRAGLPNWETLGNLMTLFLPQTILHNVVIAGGNGTFSYGISQFLVVPFSWILIAGVVAYLFTARKRCIDTSMSLAIAASAVLFAPVLALAMSLVQGIQFEIPQRYGAALLPGFLFAAAILIKGKVASWTVIAYSGLLLLYVLVTAFHYGAYG